jgi:putative transposase
MLAVALEEEVAASIAAHAGEGDARGHRLVRRNGHARQRTVTTGAGPVPVAAPRVDDRRVDPTSGERVRFRSVILPPWCRKSPKVAEVLPLLYLHGMSSGDFVPALEGFFGAAAGLSASVITRLTTQWQAEREAFMAPSLADRDYLDVGADGVHFNVRLAEERLCTLVIIGVRSDGTKELVAVADGLRWVDRVVGGAAGGSAPARHAGTGAGGWRRRPWLWAALRDVFPATRTQRCWVHKTANVLAALPTSVHTGARRALAEISGAEDREHAEQAIAQFATDYGAKWPKAVAKVTDDIEALLAFDFPAEHWVHLKTTNPVESTFATVRLRTRVTKGPGSKQAGLAMAFKLLEAAEQRWRAVNGPHLVALVRAGAVFRKGVLIARPDQEQEAAA